MKKYLSAVALAVFVTGAVAAQTPSTPPKPRVQLDGNTPVSDAGGNAVPYNVWRQMLRSGEFRLKPAPGTTAAAPAFVLVKQTEAEREQYLAKLPPPKDSPFFTTGQTLPTFKLRDLNGRKVDTKELAGKIVVLNFWFIGCPTCRVEIPELNKLVEQNKQRPDVVFLAIALDEREAIKEFVQKQAYDYTLIPGGRYLAQQFGISSFPTNVVLDRQGKIVFHAQYHDNMKAYLQKAIDTVDKVQ